MIVKTRNPERKGTQQCRLCSTPVQRDITRYIELALCLQDKIRSINRSVAKWMGKSAAVIVKGICGKSQPSEPTRPDGSHAGPECHPSREPHGLYKVLTWDYFFVNHTARNLRISRHHYHYRLNLYLVTLSRNTSYFVKHDRLFLW